jgi:hypothetical protein
MFSIANVNYNRKKSPMTRTVSEIHSDSYSFRTGACNLAPPKHEDVDELGPRDYTCMGMNV